MSNELPHLSPTSSLSPAPSPRKKRKLPGFFWRNPKPSTQTILASPVDDDGVEIAETEPNEERPPQSLVNIAMSHEEGPTLRLLPLNRADSSHSLRTRMKKYVDVPRHRNGELVLPGTEGEGKGKVLVKYEWDYVFEHQRGFRFLSTPLFSSDGLSPLDPPAFSTTGPHPVPCSLDNFQLPSPEWKWAGDGWCVDMRGDGEVQEDGFEYNWFFRRHGWSPKIGFLSTGAFVRRRRWMRLRYLVVSNRGHDPHDSPSTHLPPQAKSPDELDPWHRLLHELKSTDVDRERMEIVKRWIGELPKERETLIREHWTDAMGFFVYAYSKTAFRDMLVGMGWEDLPDNVADTFWDQPSAGQDEVEPETRHAEVQPLNLDIEGNIVQ